MPGGKLQVLRETVDGRIREEETRASDGGGLFADGSGDGVKVEILARDGQADVGGGRWGFVWLGITGIPKLPRSQFWGKIGGIVTLNNIVKLV